MEEVITGLACVARAATNAGLADQIIPAQYLSFNPSIPDERKFFGMYAMSSVPEGQRGLCRRATSPSSARTSSRAITRSSSAARTSAAAPAASTPRSRWPRRASSASSPSSTPASSSATASTAATSSPRIHRTPRRKIRTGDELEVHLERRLRPQQDPQRALRPQAARRRAADHRSRRRVQLRSCIHPGR